MLTGCSLTLTGCSLTLTRCSLTLTGCSLWYTVHFQNDHFQSIGFVVNNLTIHSINTMYYPYGNIIERVTQGLFVRLSTKRIMAVMSINGSLSLNLFILAAIHGG